MDTLVPLRPTLRMPARTGLLVLLGLLAVTAAGLLWLPPVQQNPAYHHFADQRPLYGIPNFWNVVTNLPFLAVAILGARIRPVVTESWERAAHWLMVLSAAAVALGSGYYHWAPDSTTLFWDRLPMTLIFMSLLAVTLGERLSPRLGRLALVPLVALGVFSVLQWRWSGDLRLYGAVQFFPMLALPLMLLLCPPRYARQSGVWWMIGLYLVAKLLELNDAALFEWLPGGGHPWKHLAAAGALAAYFRTLAARTPVTPVA